MIQAITAFLTSVFDVSSGTAEIIAVSLVGLGLLAIFAGLAYAIAKIGEGSGSAIDSLGQGIAMLPAGIGEAIKSTGHGVDEFLSTPKAMVNKAAEVEVARINAAKESFDLTVSDGKGRSVSLKLSGDNANQAAREVVESIGGPSRAVFGNSAVRVLTNNNSGDEA